MAKKAIRPATRFFALVVGFVFLALAFSGVVVFYHNSTMYASITGSSPQSEPIGPGGGGPIPATSPNWAGYVVTSSASNQQHVMTYVSGTWSVQGVTFNTWGTRQSVQWVGIGGWYINENTNNVDPTLIQAGTMTQSGPYDEQLYYAWYELVGSGMGMVKVFAVNPGQVINVKISYLGNNEWNIDIQDANGLSYNNNFSYVSNFYSAEWIEERPATASGYEPLTDFGQAYYGPYYGGTLSSVSNTAIISGTLYNTISSMPAVFEVTMQDSSGSTLAYPSSILSDGDSFPVTWENAV